MTINGIDGINTQTGQMGTNQAADSYSRNIQNQISNLQKQLQELSSNEDMVLEEKMKKRTQIQQQISDLNVQLRQHQMEQRRMKQQTKDSSMDNTPGDAKNAVSTKKGGKSAGFSKAGMTAMISADNFMKQAKVQGSVATRMEDRAGVLEAEIKQDKGKNTQLKEEELASVKQKAQKAASSQLSILADANKSIEEAATADKDVENHAEKTADKDVENTNGKEKDLEEGASGMADVADTLRQTTSYVSVDIRL